MDPNHWNTYNLPYTGSPGGLAPSHSSLNRLDLHSGLSLGHSLQATHGSLSGRGMSAIPGVNYSGLGVPLLDTMSPLTSGISGQAGHKAISLAQGQLVFDHPQARGSLDQLSPSISRYESGSSSSSSSNKALRSEPISPRDAAVARSQIMEAARVYGSTNFPASSLYSQFVSTMSEVPVSANALVSSPSVGNSMNLQKSTEVSFHNPPPAHSSGIPRVSTVQRISHSSEPSYVRSVENLIPSSLAHAGTLYSSSVDKGILSSHQQSSLHRQTSLHVQHGYSSSREDIEDLSSNSQNQLYGSYANLTDAHDFTATQLSADMNYEAVSPAPPLNTETAQSHSENPSFSVGHFSEFSNLASEQPHNLTDKFQENDYRLKMDARLQQVNQDVLTYSHLSQERQDLSLPKMSKDLAGYVQSIQANQRTTIMEQPNALNQTLDLPHGVQTASTNVNHLLQPISLTSPSSLQQNQTKPPIQALADSTTKPKRRSRKKKDSNITASVINTDNIKKSASQESLNSIQRQTIPPQHSSNLMSMSPTSHISTHSHPALASQSSQIQQQAGYVLSGANHFSSRDSLRAHTPSMPQNYSNQEHQGYAPVPSPKISVPSNQPVMRPTEFTMPSRVTNEKVGSYKQGQRKSKQPTITDTSINQNSHLYTTNIPESPMNMQSYPGGDALLSQRGHRDSPMQDIHRGHHVSKMAPYTADGPQHTSLASQLSGLSQHSPQGSIPVDSPLYPHKLSVSGHFMTSDVMNSMPHTPVDNTSLSNTHPASHSPLEPSPVSVESSLSHAYDGARNPAMADQQEPGQFPMDFGGQPFLEQLVGVPMASTNFSQPAPENGDVVFTALGAPSDGTPLLQQQQQPQRQSNSETLKLAYHEDALHEVRPVGTLTGNLNMEDEVSFNPFFETQAGLDPQVTTPPNQVVQSFSTPAETEQMTLTFVPQVGDDDDFSHFSEETGEEIKKEPLSTRGKSESFQESFLSYLQGNKQETLSSVSSAAITKRPQLPKYIPEPRRPKPPPPPPPPPAVSKDCSIVVSDDENPASTNSSVKVSKLHFSHNNKDDTSHKSEKSDKDGYSVQRTSELAVKITLPKKKKNIAGESVLLSHNKKMKESDVKVKKRKGKHRGSDEDDDYAPGQTTDNIASSPQILASQKAPLKPARASIGRKAKEKVIENSRKRSAYGGSGSSTEEEPSLMYPASKKIYKADDSDQNYDSDKDPVWMPFEVDLKPGTDFDEKRKKTRRSRSRLSSGKSSRPPVAKTSSLSSPPAPAAKKKAVVAIEPCDAEVSALTASQGAANEQGKSNSALYRTGQYLIEKKDLQNYEGYPIWRLEDDASMIHKYELIVQGNAVKHKGVGTYSTWMKSMQSQFEPVQVKELAMKGREAILVQVMEEFRPKPPSDGKLILQYEDDPLVDQFNIYLQVFISQALEPTFLKTIIERKEPFYGEALQAIDQTVQTKLEELTGQAQWTVPFRKALHKFPLMKEIDRPNLKQACQACNNSSPPTIKSVVFSGNAYDKVLVTDKLSPFADAQEFMIGKRATHYVRTYHSLCHFKYWLHRRCQSKVKLMRESSKTESLSGETILDRCLENRNWVLQLFDDLKKLLIFGDDVPR